MLQKSGPGPSVSCQAIRSDIKAEARNGIAAQRREGLQGQHEQAAGDGVEVVGHGAAPLLSDAPLCAPAPEPRLSRAFTSRSSAHENGRVD